LFRMRYNHFRPHTSLEKKNPAEVYFDFSKLFYGVGHMSVGRTLPVNKYL